MSFLILAVLPFAQLVCAYTNSEYGFSITPPNTWNAVNPPPSPALVEFTDPNIATTGASMNVFATPTTSTLAQYVQGAVQGLTSDGYTVVSQNSITISGMNGEQLVSTSLVDNNNFQTTQDIFVEKGNAYIITLGAFESQYDNVASELSASANSFTVNSVSSGLTSSTSTIEIVGAVVAVIVVVVVVVVLLMRRKRKTEPGSNVVSSPPIPPPPPPYP